MKRCIDSFAMFDKGVPRVVGSGEIVSDKDEAVKVAPRHFEDVETHVQARERGRRGIIATARDAVGRRGVTRQVAEDDEAPVETARRAGGRGGRGRVTERKSPAKKAAARKAAPLPAEEDAPQLTEDMEPLDLGGERIEYK